MSGIAPPRHGDGVSILASHGVPLRGQVTGRWRDALTIELEQTAIRRPFHFAPGSQVELEWIHPLGVMQVTATVESARAEPRPTLEIGLVGEPQPVERREHERVPIELAVSAWTLAQPTRRLAGNTVDLSVGGALLRLPDLAPLAATLELELALPGGSLHVSAGIRWRGEPARVGVEFERVSPEQRARLVDFLHSRD